MLFLCAFKYEFDPHENEYIMDYYMSVKIIACLLRLVIYKSSIGAVCTDIARALWELKL